MSIIWTIVIGFIVGLIARFVSPGPHNPSGFILTTVLGIVGAALATWLGQQIGWYSSGDKAGFIGAIIGSILVLMIWRVFARSA
ncbi:membrane protein [Labrys miyagiensis]|uniref:Membrane protein n=1 Tax=Labrys miyagiensis TaxID=346912 RepID=A0ABQ6CN60_9HYPH|nr:GlsB/YeaQ/YmgE family stress response membrane protein [Labrys miyagiensis]GLS21255.1 membrane protein [Labrys miyagiensis]